MSHENVEILRRLNAAFNRGDPEGALADFAADVEFRDVQPAPDSPECLYGRAAVLAYWEQWIDSFAGFTAEVEEYIDAGDRVLTVTRWRARGRDSGVVLDLRTVDVYELADGQVIRAAVGYPDREAALGGDQDLREAKAREIERMVHAGYEWFNREREPPPTWHPDGEYVNAREDPDHAVHRGIEAIRAQHRGWVEAYPDLQVEPLEILTNGDLAFVWTRFTGHGADSGLPMEMELAHVLTIERGRARRLVEYFDRHEALDAAGLSGGERHRH